MGTGIFVGQVLPDEIAGGLPVQLFADVHADIQAELATVAETLGGAEFVMHGPTRQIGRQLAAPMRPATALASVGVSRTRRRSGRLAWVRGGARVAEQQRLIGTETLSALAIQALDQQGDAVPQRLLSATLLAQREGQFEDHAFERGQVVGQLLEGRQRHVMGRDSGSRGSHRAHTFLDAAGAGKIRRKTRKKWKNLCIDTPLSLGASSAVGLSAPPTKNGRLESVRGR